MPKGTAINLTTTGTAVGSTRLVRKTLTLVTSNKMAISTGGTLILTGSTVTGVIPDPRKVSGKTKLVAIVITTKPTAPAVTPSLTVAKSGPC